MNTHPLPKAAGKFRYPREARARKCMILARSASLYMCDFLHELRAYVCAKSYTRSEFHNGFVCTPHNMYEISHESK
jgi:hypothetical protein